MFSMAWAFEWLTGAAVMSLVLSLLGSVAVLCFREPVRRMRIIVLTLAGCVLAPAFTFLPGLPHWSLPQWTPTPVLETAAAMAHIAGRPEPLPSREAVQPATDEAPVAISPTSDTSGSPENTAEMARDFEYEPRVVNADPDVADGTPSHIDSDPAYVEPTLSTFPQTAAAGLATESQAMGFDPKPWIVGIYLAVLIGLSGWWLAGLVGLQRILGEARPAPESCRGLLRQIAGPPADNIRVLISSRAAQPFTFGWRRPVIVLPTEMCRAAENVEPTSPPFPNKPQASALITTTALRWSLAHEWAHVVRGDVRVWSLAGLVRTVFFYQPLCWWLRAQLRLCQDYLADAAAAQETSPETYAEFLATRAAGRPLAIGLGIAGGKSDLYRRVAMLVRNRRSLETRCPRWWSATAAGAAILLVFVAATLGDKPPTTAAEVLARGVAATDDGKQAGEVKPKSAKSEAEPAKQGPAKTQKGTPEGNLQKLLDGLFARSAAIKSGRFTAQVEWGDQRRRGSASPGGPSAGGHAGPPAMMRMPGMAGGAGSRGMGPPGGSPFGGPTQIELVVSGESWRQRPGPDGEDFFISHAGRSLSYRDQVAQHPAGADDDSEGFEHTLTIAWPGGPGDVLRGRMLEPIGAGTIWYSESIPYLREHVAAARLKGTARVNQIETQVIDWSIPADDAGPAFQKPNALLAGGGIFRVHVAPLLGHAVVRIEFIDRFDTAQSTFEFSEFKEVAAKIHFPHLIHIREGAREKTISVLKVSNVNEAIKEREFLPPIPSGTRIQDQRPHRADVADEGGEYQPGAAILSLRSFITGAEYPEGLPAAMLAEMDRDVLSPEEYRGQRATQAEERAKSGAISRRPSTKRDGPATAKWPASYGGKRLDEWRRVLLTDLEPETRIKAVKALGAFGPATGHAEEAAAAVAEALSKDDRVEGNFKFQEAACSALARLGAAGIPALELELESEVAQPRQNAISALITMARGTDAAVVALLKAAKHRGASIRGYACEALAKYYPTAPRVADVLVQAFPEEPGWRRRIVQGLRDSKAPAGEIAKLATSFLQDDDVNVRVIAAALLAVRGAPTAENVAVIQKVVVFDNDNDRYAFQVFVDEIYSPHQDRSGPVPVPELVTPVLIVIVESTKDAELALKCLSILGRIAHDKAAHPAIPVLIEGVQGELPAKVDQDRVVLSAVVTLGKFGPAAQEALPALKALREQLLKTPNLADQLLSEVKSAIRKIEAEK